MTARLSVVMPTHDRAAEMRRAAASVLEQEVDLELVVVDDHSTDATAEELDRLTGADRRVRVVRAPGATPLGPCAARNLGLAEAGGDLVSFCDDDDAWAPGAGRTMLEFLEAHPRLVMASSWHRVLHVDTGRSVVFRGPTEYGVAELLWQNVVALPFAVIRRGALPFDVGFDPALPTGEDWDLWLRCAQHGPVRSVPEACYVYAQHGGNRVTRTGEGQAVGRRGFLDKHGAAMTPACRLYHEAVLAGYAGGRRAMLGAALGAGRHAPARAAAVAGLLGLATTASRVGQRRGDPGLQARLMASLVGRAGRHPSPDD